METTSSKTPALTPEQILRAADYVELAWREQGSKEEKAALAEFHADGPEPARLIGEFGALLLSDHLTAVPDEHTDCESAYVLGQLVTVAGRYLKRWCLAGGSAHTAWIAAGFLIECMQETDQVHQVPHRHPRQRQDVAGSGCRRTAGTRQRPGIRGRRLLLPRMPTSPAECRTRRTRSRNDARPRPQQWTPDAVHSPGDVVHRMHCIGCHALPPGGAPGGSA